MIHQSRLWATEYYDEIEELGYNLSEVTWPLCAGFEFNNLFFLNDSAPSDVRSTYRVLSRYYDYYDELGTIIPVRHNDKEIIRQINSIPNESIFRARCPPLIKLKIESYQDHESQGCYLCKW